MCNGITMIQCFLSLFFPTQRTSTPMQLTCSQCTPLHVRQEELRHQGTMFLDALTACSAYAASKDLQQGIRQFKYEGKRSMVTSFSPLFSATVNLYPLHEGAVLCPVPLHWMRYCSRGFNQAALLAEELSSIVRHPVVQYLRRHRSTGHQAWRSHDERRLAIHDAFSIVRHPPHHVTLVDDVATTLSTLDACAEVLKNAGVKHVDAIVVALG